jgi:hypothetical protein
MGIARFEKVIINNLTFTQSEFGEVTTVITPWFYVMASVSSVFNNVRIAAQYRDYEQMVNFRFNYTPNTQTIANNQNVYSITYKTKDYRITDVKESDDRMSVLFLCYTNKPVTAV